MGTTVPTEPGPQDAPDLPARPADHRPGGPQLPGPHLAGPQAAGPAIALFVAILIAITIAVACYLAAPRRAGALPVAADHSCPECPDSGRAEVTDR